MKLRTLPVCSLLVLSALALAFQNCGESSFKESASLNAENDGLNEDQLLEILDEANLKASSLDDVTDESMRAEALKLSARIQTSKNKIRTLLGEGVSIGHPKILTEVDFLVYLMSEAGDKLIMADLEKLKDEVAANRQRITSLGSELNEFKETVNARLDQVDLLIESLEQKQDDLLYMYDQLRADTQLADLALRNALERLENHVNVNVAELYRINNQLAKDIVEQKGALEELFDANNRVANLQGRMCTLSSTSATFEITDARPVCNGSDLENPNCCLTVNAVDCSTLFPGATSVAARNQCEIIIASIKNHDAQLQAIREVDEKQTELISGLLNDVENLNQQTQILADGQVILADGLKALSNKVNAIDARLMIVEFKAARAEAASSISERVDMTKAWIVQRQRDIRTRFCSSNFHKGRKMFDYEAQRHNHDYCHSKLKVLNHAMVALQNIGGLTNGIASLNVDGACSATVAGKNAEALTISELTRPNIFKELNEKCDLGPALVKARLLNAVKALAVVAPDFRTIGYMQKKAKIAQIIFLGSTLADASSSTKKYFVDVNPVSKKNIKTAFGQIESLFKNKYVANILRDSSGRFPADISVIAKASIPSSNAVYSHREIASASNSYLKALKASELSCAQCSWGVRGRSNAGSVSTGTLGTSKVAYPKDVETGLCPIQNDVVVLKEKNNDKYYAYLINYDSAGREIVKGLNWGGNHVQVASSTANFNNGLTRTGRFWNSRTIYKNGLPNMDLRGRFVLNVTRPYGKVYTGKGHCVHFTAAAPLKNNEWVAKDRNTSLLYRFLSGYNSAVGSVLDNKCKLNKGSLSKVRSVALTDEENARIYIADSVGNDLATFTKRSLASNKNTQLGSDYWVTKRKGLNYGTVSSPMETVSQSSPFFGPATTSTQAIKAWRRANRSDKIVKQECTPNE